MDKRTLMRLEEEHNRNIKRISKGINELDRYYDRSVRENDSLIQRIHQCFNGDVEDFTRYMSKVKQNESKFEMSLNKQKRSFENEKREVVREYDKKIRSGR